MIEYQIACGEDSLDLLKSVREWIIMGYKPQGGICFSMELGVRVFYQAMIRETQ